MGQEKKEISYGTAGLVMSCLSFLSLIHSGGNLALWFLVAFGVLIGLAGVIVCLIGLFSKTGRAQAAGGLLLYGVLMGLRIALS